MGAPRPPPAVAATLALCAAATAAGDPPDLTGLSYGSGLPWSSVGIIDRSNYSCQAQGGDYSLKLDSVDNIPATGKWWKVSIDQAPGFKIRIHGYKGKPLGLIFLYNINDANNDEIFDCYAKAASWDTSSCYNSVIELGFRLPKPVVFTPKMTIRFGVMPCPQDTPGLVKNADERFDGTQPLYVSFWTPARYDGTSTQTNSAACIDQLQEVGGTPAPMCNDNAAAAAAAGALAVFLPLAVAALL